MIVGIDLGTSNTAMAWVDPAHGPNAPIHDFPIRQEVRPGELAERPVLPSCLYLPLENESLIVGECARWLGAKTAGRLVASAKSWLCHAGIDRQAPILPWGGGPELRKLSPVDASQKILECLVRSWNEKHPTAPLQQQEVVITVPASFDDVARALTVTAAKRAGLERFTLLEEPQAAFYDFTARFREKLSTALKGVHRVLVVDVGGGTTDFTLVDVEALPEGPAMKRVAVGDHLMLGGDNMDAALAHRAESKLTGKRLSSQQWAQLVQSSRGVKEVLLGLDAPKSQSVAVAAAGSRLVGGTVSVELAQDEVEALVVDGFFPKVPLSASIQKTQRAAALSELGLPYESDPAITRHLAAFLSAHGGVRPDAILLNGGVFNSQKLVAALVDGVSAFWPEQPRISLLEHDSLDLAVARGAAYYGLARRGLGRKIQGGAARAYFVALQGGKALCLIPRGFEEGQSVELKERAFTLTLDRPVQFELYSTSHERADAAGALVELDETFQVMPPIHTVLKGGQSSGETKVHVVAGLTEIGTLELSLVSNERDERWRLEFELRGGARSKAANTVTESMPARFSEAVTEVQKVFGHKPLPVGPKDVKNLFRTLEKSLGAKDTWRAPLLRELWSNLFAGVQKRRRSEDHERVFFQLLGFSLRPGFGYPLDEWRAEQTFKLFRESVTHHQSKPVWIEFWVMWRRLAGGLNEAAQRELFDYLSLYLDPTRKKPKGIQPEGFEEMVRTAASLEWVDPQEKEKLGDWVLSRLLDPATRGGPWAWALGRLGARAPLYASGHKVVPPEVATRWIEALLSRSTADDVSFALAQIARRTLDRTRDIDEDLRDRTMDALKAAKAPDAWVSALFEVGWLSQADEARALGDTLPQGLSL